MCFLFISRRKSTPNVPSTMAHPIVSHVLLMEKKIGTAWHPRTHYSNDRICKSSQVMQFWTMKSVSYLRAIAHAADPLWESKAGVLRQI